MDPALWLAVIPLWLSAIIVVVVPTCLSMLGPIWVRRHVGLERLTANNEVAGFKFAVLGVVYAVLLGFAVIVVWEKFRDAESAVAQEAGTTAALYRLSDGLGTEEGKALHDRLDAYVRATIEDEWPAMSRGKASPTETRALNDLYSVVLAGRSEDARAVTVLSEVLTELNQLTTARRERMVLAEGVVPGVIWLVLWLGAAATIGFTFFFGTRNLHAQTLMTGSLALIIFMGLLVILSINRPFTGDVSVSPAPLEAVLRDFGGGA